MARVLIVEDNEVNLELVVYLLEAFNHATLVARDGLEGWQIAQTELPDLILLDVHLPKLDGYELVQRLKSDPQTRPIPVVAVTALAMVGDRDKVLGAGFDGYITKPIDPQTMVSQVESFLNLSSRGFR